MEDWKRIIGFDRYLVSNNGNVKSLISIDTDGRVLKPWDSNGYLRVELRRDNNGFIKPIHRLVALHFVKNPLNKKFINHKDGNKLNNNATNLEWCTRSENMKHAFRLGLCNTDGYKNNNASFTKNDVIKIRKEYRSTPSTQKDLSNKYNVSLKTISRIIRKETYTNI